MKKYSSNLIRNSWNIPLSLSVSDICRFAENIGITLKKKLKSQKELLNISTLHIFQITMSKILGENANDKISLVNSKRNTEMEKVCQAKAYI